MGKSDDVLWDELEKEWELPVADDRDLTGNAGVGLAQFIVCQDIKWAFRPQYISDYGVDAHIEILEDTKPTGKLLGVQVKCGSSFIKQTKKDKENLFFYGQMKHYNYWNIHALPIIVMLVDPQDKKIYWADINDNNIEKRKNSFKLTIPIRQQLTEESKEKLFTLAEERFSHQFRYIKLETMLSLYKQTSNIRVNFDKVKKIATIYLTRTQDYEPRNEQIKVPYENTEQEFLELVFPTIEFVSQEPDIPDPSWYISDKWSTLVSSFDIVKSYLTTGIDPKIKYTLVTNEE